MPGSADNTTLPLRPQVLAVESARLARNVEIRVDFNRRGRGGLVKGSVHRVTGGPLRLGQMVRAVEPDEDLAFVATVVAINDPRVWLDVHWNRPLAVKA